MTAFMDAVTTAVVGIERAYPAGQVPETPTYPYGAYRASLGRASAYSLCGRHGMRHGRITVQTFGRTYDAAVTKADEFIDALLDQTLTVPDWRVTPPRISLPPSDVRSEDPENTGIHGVTATLSFTATKEP